ncbi:hypothetical protein [Shinella sp. YE25]|nr:hypothetical protein [Shinella sp. YE25]
MSRLTSLPKFFDVSLRVVGWKYATVISTVAPKSDSPSPGGASDPATL